jgi:alkylation response protein AidB-like acyl-CoA dehydrogenase
MVYARDNVAGKNWRTGVGFFTAPENDCHRSRLLVPSKAAAGSDEFASSARRCHSATAAACDVGDRAFANGADYDEDGAFPAAEIAALHEARLLVAILPGEYGGVALGGLALCEVLRQIGSGSLPLGRLFEGHVNAISLVLGYGQPEQVRLIAREAHEGHLFAVWNTDHAENLRLICEGGRYRLEGRKVLASGAGRIERPLVTATDEVGRRLIVMPHLRSGERADLSRWTAHGMRASATGTVDFSGLAVDPIEIVGVHGDYQRQPAFSGGAWRFAAVHQGGLERLLDLLREDLRRTGRGDDPHQAARLGQAAIATETGRLWVERAAAVAQDPAQARPSAQIVAYVNLARLAVERAGLDLMELVHRSVGLQGFMRPHPIERISRDLATYLRQPGPDRALTSAATWVLERDTPASELWGS